MKPTLWRRLMTVDLDGVVLGVKHGLAAIRRHGDAVIAYPASDAVRYVTGAELVIDGGCSAG